MSFQAMNDNPPLFLVIMATIRTIYRLYMLKRMGTHPSLLIGAYTNINKFADRTWSDALVKENVGGFCPTPCDLAGVFLSWWRMDCASNSLRQFLEIDDECEDMAESFLENGVLAPAVGHAPGVVVTKSDTSDNSPISTEATATIPADKAEETAQGETKQSTAEGAEASPRSEPEVSTPENSGGTPKGKVDSKANAEAKVEAGATGKDEDPPGAVEEAVPTIVPAMVCPDPVVIRQHRRVRAHDTYGKLILAEVRSKFGLPKRSSANQLAIRRFAESVMKTHGVRPIDRARILPFIVAAAFIPTLEDIAAGSWLECSEAVERLAMMPKGSFQTE